MGDAAASTRRGWRRRIAGALLALVALVPVLAFQPAPTKGSAGTPEERFREATALIRSGDGQRGLAVYRELAASGHDSASLYWNWAQTVAARGASGEALWALLRARELEPGDAAIGREIEKLRDATNLDAAELAPEPLAALARLSRRLHLGLLAALLLAASLVLHAVSRLNRMARWPVGAAWASFALGAAVALALLAASSARPTGVVVRRGAPLADAASPTAGALATLREGEVVPVLATSGGYVRLQDSSGARGWANERDVWRLDAPPPVAP